MKVPLETPDDLKLRKAGQGDKDFAYQVKRAAFREYVEQVWGWEEDEQRKLHDRRFRPEDFLIINLDGTDVGTMWSALDSDCVHVNQLYSLPEHQGQGIGRRCMLMAIDWGSELGLPVRLRVLRVNPRAAAFYEGLDFTITGETDTHFLMEKSE